ncbi:MAG: hypothetical protein DSO03_01660 [Hadesarchaea archaeon]|nr:MAG: hypothetical protein DSO03_01660 [Hadesarchaea archaeon]
MGQEDHGHRNQPPVNRESRDHPRKYEPRPGHGKFGPPQYEVGVEEEVEEDEEHEEEAHIDPNFPEPDPSLFPPLGHTIDDPQTPFGPPEEHPPLQRKSVLLQVPLPVEEEEDRPKGTQTQEE